MPATNRPGAADARLLEQESTNYLQARGWIVDYIAIRRRRDLHKPSLAEMLAGEPLVALAAAKLGATRLIDNLEL